MTGTGQHRFRTVEDVVTHLISTMTMAEKNEIREMGEDDLILLHADLGGAIRDEYGLWAGNRNLLRSCGSEEMHPDDASMVIIGALWKRLQTRHLSPDGHHHLR